MNGEDKEAAAQAEEAASREPGMGAALLAVLVMLLSTGILAGFVYIVMIAATPAGSDQPKKKAAAVEQPSFKRHTRM